MLHLDMDVAEEVAWAVSTHATEAATSQEQFQAALRLLNQAVDSFFAGKQYRDRPSLIGYTVFESFFSLMRRNCNQHWWRDVEKDWRISLERAQAVTGWFWQDRWRTLVSLHPRLLAWKTWVAR
jgi:hypothetical protein